MVLIWLLLKSLTKEQMIISKDALPAPLKVDLIYVVVYFLSQKQRMSHLIKPEGQLSDRIETFDVAPLFFPPICFVSMHLSRFPFFSSFFPLPPFHPPLIISPHPQSRSRHNGAVVWRFWKELMETTSLLSSHSCVHTCARAHTRALLWISSITVLDLLHLLNSTHLFIYFLHQLNAHLNIMLKCNICWQREDIFCEIRTICLVLRTLKTCLWGSWFVNYS